MKFRKSGHIRFGALALGMVASGPVLAVEYPLEFTPTGNYQSLVVAGYQIVGNTVVGNCSYTSVTSGSGRDPRSFYTPIPQTCTWNLYGALLSVAAGAPAIPAPIVTRGTETIYAQKSARIYTGTDTALNQRGFVFTFGSHYDWLTSNAYLVLPQQPYTFTVSLVSDGDEPLAMGEVLASTALSQTTLSVDSSTCSGKLPVGATCDVTLTYDDASLTSPTGLAYDAFTIRVVNTAGVKPNFVQRVTDDVALPPDWMARE